MRCLGDTKRYDSAKRRRKLRRALLSVYYHSAGREFEVRGAPSVLLPPEIEVMSLQDALAVIARSRQPRLDEALWRVVQNVSLPEERTQSPTYPAALGLYFDTQELELLTTLRRNFRRGSNIFELALTSARQTGPQAGMLGPRLRLARSRPPNRPPSRVAANDVDFGTALDDILKYGGDRNYPEKLLEPIKSARKPGQSPRARLSRQLSVMRADLGMGSKEIVSNLADLAAFRRIIKARCDRLHLDRETNRRSTVYPVKTTVRQDTKSLAVNATVTTIVHGTWANLTRNMWPDRWATSSDVITKSDFVQDAFSLEKYPNDSQRLDKKRPTPDRQKPLLRLLDEVVEIVWDQSELQRARYHNVLNVEFSASEPKGEADVTYNLCRSIKSSILWDRGPGGLLMDEGYIKLRRLGNDVWRVTMHKEIAFGDQAGSGTGSGIQDLSHIISLLAPVAITYWLEGEVYSLGDPNPDD